jgi:hypothetical protein
MFTPPGLHTLPEFVKHPPFIYFLCMKTISFIYFKCENYTHSSTGIIQNKLCFIYECNEYLSPLAQPLRWYNWVLTLSAVERLFVLQSVKTYMYVKSLPEIVIFFLSRKWLICSFPEVFFGHSYIPIICFNL